MLLTELKTFDLECLIVNSAYVLSVKKFGTVLYKCAVDCPMTSFLARQVINLMLILEDRKTHSSEKMQMVLPSYLLIRLILSSF